jgi:hypothetical protein
MQYNGSSFALLDPRTVLKSTGTEARAISINMNTVRRLDKLRKRSTIVSSMLNFARSWIQPWHVEWKFRGDVTGKSFTNQTDDTYIAMQFDQLPQNALCDFLTFGFCVVRYLKIGNIEGDAPQNYRPVVVDPDNYQVIMMYNEKTGMKEYKALHFSTTTLVKDEIENSRVYVFRHPNVLTGDINSPLVACYESIVGLEESTALTMVCQDRMTYPLTYYEKTKNDMVIRDQQISTEHESANDRSLFDSAKQFQLQQEEIAKLNMHQISEKVLNNNIAGMGATEDMQEQAAFRNPSMASSRQVFLQYNREMPHLPTLKLPLNVKLTHGALSQPLPNYLDFQNKLRDEIAQAFGIPSSVIFGGNNKFAADVAFTKLQLGQTVKEWEHSLSNVLIRTYMDIYYTSIERDLRGKLNKRIEKRMKDDKRSADRIGYRRVKITVSEKIYQKITSNLHFSIFFEKVTLLDPDYVQTLYNTEVIDYVTFQKLMLSIGNIPQVNRNLNAHPPPTGSVSAAKRIKTSAVDEGVDTSLSEKLNESEKKLNKEAQLSE